jgi:hypothetical protein
MQIDLRHQLRSIKRYCWSMARSQTRDFIRSMVLLPCVTIRMRSLL